jgi:hypothetical protein
MRSADRPNQLDAGDLARRVIDILQVDPRVREVPR